MGGLRRQTSLNPRLRRMSSTDSIRVTAGTDNALAKARRRTSSPRSPVVRRNSSELISLAAEKDRHARAAADTTEHEAGEQVVEGEEQTMAATEAPTPSKKSKAARQAAKGRALGRGDELPEQSVDEATPLEQTDGAEAEEDLVNAMELASPTEVLFEMERAVGVGVEEGKGGDRKTSIDHEMPLATAPHLPDLHEDGEEEEEEAAAAVQPHHAQPPRSSTL